MPRPSRVDSRALRRASTGGGVCVVQARVEADLGRQDDVLPHVDGAVAMTGGRGVGVLDGDPEDLVLRVEPADEVHVRLRQLVLVGHDDEEQPLPVVSTDVLELVADAGSSATPGWCGPG